MRTHAVPWCILLAIAALSFAAYQGAMGVVRTMDSWTEDVPDISHFDFTDHARESVMYASDGSTLLAAFQLEKRSPVDSSAISPFVLQATVDTEDIRFYEHNGVDMPGIARAAINNLRGGDLEGASTITQQLIRNTVLSQEATDISFERKVREAELALELEKIYGKTEILTMYLNTINYGDGCYGIEAAAQNYFQVSALDLTLAQAAALVGIPQSPSNLNPKIYPDACLARRNIVLDRMLAAGHITKEEHDTAAAEPLGLNPAPAAPQDGIYAYPYFTSYVRDKLLEENNPYHCSYADLFKGGLTIYTSLDPAMQAMAEDACNAQRGRMDGDLEASLVAVDVKTGQVKAMVGGADYATSQVNLAVGSEGGGTGRQAGSSFKAFTLTAAIEQGINPATLIDCTSPLTIGADTFENFDNINYGIRSIQSAIDVSSNTGFINLSQAIGPQSVTEMAKRMGIGTKLESVLTATLGVASVSPLEMASAYATLASGGIKRSSVVVTKIVDGEGTVIYEAPDSSQRVLSEEVAGAATKVLQTVFTSSSGTANSAQLYSGQPVAGKTGTSEQFADHWLVGFTPSLSCATWIGNPAGSVETSHWLSCNDLWRDFMSQATAGQAYEPFPSTASPTYNNAFNESQTKKYAEKDPATAPSMVGLTLSEAANRLSGYKASYYESYSSTVPSGTVISQTVSDGQVILNVSKGPQPSTATSRTESPSTAPTNGSQTNVSP